MLLKVSWCYCFLSRGDETCRGVAWRWEPLETAVVGGGYSFIGDDARRMKGEKDEDEEEEEAKEASVFFSW